MMSKNSNSNYKFSPIFKFVFFNIVIFSAATIGHNVGIAFVYHKTMYVRERLLLEKKMKISREKILEDNQGNLYESYPFVKLSTNIQDDEEVVLNRKKNKFNP